jgi:hypothetical protein
LLRIEAPVVVNPEIVSKKASVKVGILPLIQKGNRPISENIIQVKVTITEPSRLPIDKEGFLPKYKASIENEKLINDEIRKK